MALDRDDLAARCLVALLGNAERAGDDGAYAVDAVALADALLARLAETAPVAATAAYVPKVGDYVTSRALDKDEMATLRPATPAERESAGLDAPAAAPVDERAVDRVALAKVLRAAFHRWHFNYAPDAWGNCTETAKRGYLAQADAAIAFLRGDTK